MLPTIKWEDNQVIMVDQRKLPAEEVYVRCSDYVQVAEAIETSSGSKTNFGPG
jgi:methylthioribose-1-phosphate isomerase